MLHKRLQIGLLFLLSFGKINAQPEICSLPADMTSFCLDACIVCDIDGFEGRHESNIQGETPPDFCTVLAQNPQWIAFIAGSENLKIQLDVSNCDLGPGLEVGIFRGVNCEDFELVTNCIGANTSVEEGTSAEFENIVPLEIGQYYFLVMDGAFGDNCDWKFTVLEGSTLANALNESGEILGSTFTCPGTPISYQVDIPVGATEFEWTVDGATVGTSNDNIEVTFPNPGFYNLCVTSFNVCNEGPPTCIQIQVEGLPPTEFSDFLCEGSVYEIADTIISDGGFYEITLTNIDGCDSIVTLELTEVQNPILNLDLNICQGDTLFVGNFPFTQTGVYQEILTSQYGCDSTVNLDLFSVVCNIMITDSSTPIPCFGGTSGVLEFSVFNGTPPFSYNWEELNSTSLGSGNLTSLGEIVTVNNLTQGTYKVTVEDNFGNMGILYVEIYEPDLLTINFTPSNYNGSNISCNGENDGFIQAIPGGGTPPFNYLWQGGQTTNTISNLSPGVYFVTVVDAGGCITENNFELFSPTPLDFTSSSIDPTCEGVTSGSISISASTGGTPPYTYSISGNSFTSSNVFSNLAGGNYNVQMMDANDCLISAIEMLEPIDIPIINFVGIQETNLGEPFTFDPSLNNVTLQEVIWTPSNEFDCTNCLNPTFTPFNSGSYSLTVTSEDNCSDSSSVTVTVNKNRKFFAPNSFSPNGDGYNDYFTLFGGFEVESIQKLTILNRWGAVMFESEEVLSSIETLGWNGFFNGKVVNPNIYIWVAEIKFIDGEIISYSGDLTVVQ